MANPLPIFSWATSYPSDGFHQAGEVILNPSPSVGQPAGWICTTEGNSGGTWAPLVLFHNSTTSKVTAAAAIAVGTKLKVTMGPNTYTMPSAASHAAGSELITLNGSSTATDVATYAAPASTTLVGTATAIAGTAIRWMSDGANYWYRTN